MANDGYPGALVELADRIRRQALKSAWWMAAYEHEMMPTELTDTNELTVDISGFKPGEGLRRFNYNIFGPKRMNEYSGDFRRADGKGRVAAIEILLQSALVSDLIFKGELSELKDAMTRSREVGMQTFDQALFDFYEQGIITYDEAMRNADSKNELRLRIKLESKRDTAVADQESESLKIMEEDSAQTF